MAGMIFPSCALSQETPDFVEPAPHDGGAVLPNSLSIHATCERGDNLIPRSMGRIKPLQDWIERYESFSSESHQPAHSFAVRPVDHHEPDRSALVCACVDTW